MAAQIHSGAAAKHKGHGSLERVTERIKEQRVRDDSSSDPRMQFIMNMTQREKATEQDRQRTTIIQTHTEAERERDRGI